MIRYPYAPFPDAALYDRHTRRSHAQLLFLALSVLAVLVLLISFIASSVRPSTPPCGATCGPPTGSRLITAALYTNQRFGYSVEYDASVMSISGQDENGVQLQPQNGDGEEDFTASTGTDAAGAVDSAAGNLDTSTFESLQQIGPVRGAEVGLVPGVGTAYSATYVPSDGTGQAVPVGIVILAAVRNGVIITVTAVSGRDDDSRDAPYGLQEGPLFDFSLTNTIWKGAG